MKDVELNVCIHEVSSLIGEYGWNTFLYALVKNLRGVGKSLIDLRGAIKDTINQMERE